MKQLSLQKMSKSWQKCHYFIQDRLDWNEQIVTYVFIYLWYPSTYFLTPAGWLTDARAGAGAHYNQLHSPAPCCTTDYWWPSLVWFYNKDIAFVTNMYWRKWKVLKTENCSSKLMKFPVFSLLVPTVLDSKSTSDDIINDSMFNCCRRDNLFLCYPVHLFILVDYIWWVWSDQCDLYKYDGPPGHHVSPEIEMQTSVSCIIAICVLSTVLFIWGNLAIKLVTNLLFVL